jgi:hypothetical protein
MNLSHAERRLCLGLVRPSLAVPLIAQSLRCARRAAKSVPSLKKITESLITTGFDDKYREPTSTPITDTMKCIKQEFGANQVHRTCAAHQIGSDAAWW